MNSQIIKEISLLKQNYQNNNNTYEVNYNNITKEDFVNKLQNVKRICKNVSMVDNKEYVNNGMILNIDSNGNMECLSKKMLKYKIMNNVRIDLFNERQINTDNFSGSNNYQDIYKQKNIIFKQDNFSLVFSVKTRKNENAKKEEDKVIVTYDFKISFKSGENENNLNKIFSML